MSTMMVTITPNRRDEEERNILQRSKLPFLLFVLEAIFVVLFGVFVRYKPVAMPYKGEWVSVMNSTNYTTAEITSTATTTTTTTTTTSNPLNLTTLAAASMAPQNASVVLNGEVTKVWVVDPAQLAAHIVAYQRHIPDNYAIFADIHVMMFVGFGFLITFLCRYGLSGISYNFVLGAMCIQWATLTDGWIRRLRFQSQKNHDYFIYVDINTMIDSDYALAAVLVSFGAVAGQASLMQLAVMAMFEVGIYQANCLMIYDLLKANDPGYSMTVHMFGAYFGLIVSRIIAHKEVQSEASKKLASVYHSDIFAMIGTLFLWTLYPSFNAAFAKDEGRIRAIINTYYSLTASVMTAFAMTAIVKNEKFTMMHVQSATLAGGVAVGTIAGMIIHPWGAVLTGFVAGVVSVLGFQFLTPCMRKTCGLYDTRGVHNVHGIPGLISGFGSILAAGVATTGKYGDNRYDIFWEGRTVGQQAGYQAAAMAVSIATCVLGAILTGTIMKLPCWDQPRYDDILDDEPHWVTVTDIPSEEPRWREEIVTLPSQSKPTVAVTEFSQKDDS